MLLTHFSDRLPRFNFSYHFYQINPSYGDNKTAETEARAALDIFTQLEARAFAFSASGYGKASILAAALGDHGKVAEFLSHEQKVDLSEVLPGSYRGYKFLHNGNPFPDELLELFLSKGVVTDDEALWTNLLREAIDQLDETFSHICIDRGVKVDSLLSFEGFPAWQGAVAHRDMERAQLLARLGFNTHTISSIVWECFFSLQFISPLTYLQGRDAIVEYDASSPTPTAYTVNSVSDDGFAVHLSPAAGGAGASNDPLGAEEMTYVEHSFATIIEDLKALGAMSGKERLLPQFEEFWHSDSWQSILASVESRIPEQAIAALREKTPTSEPGEKLGSILFKAFEPCFK